MVRCCNIDWLECYCLEDAIGFPHNADFFRSKGFQVSERTYGTPMYNEMFIVFGSDGLPFVEVRRSPKSSQLQKGIFSPYSAHVRLVNRACYADFAARNMQQFLELYGFSFQRISRIDICYDFEKFDYGDDPCRFLKRYMSNRYSKVNQANIAAHGVDSWDGREWSSVSWGAPTSMVRTRFYNKSKELREVKDKPYIRQAWQLAGLVDDFASLEKKNDKEYKPEIWRVEFQVKSGTKKWFVVEDYNGDRKRILSKPNTLDVYFSRQQIFQVFLSLAHHYFHFKHVEYKAKSSALVAGSINAVCIDYSHKLIPQSRKAERQLQRKDRCADKKLFNYDELNQFYQVEKLASDEPRSLILDSLLTKLYDYRAHQFDEKVLNACNVIIAKLEEDVRLQSIALPRSKQEVEIIRRMLSVRLKDKSVDISSLRKVIEQTVTQEKQIWSNPY